MIKYLEVLPLLIVINIGLGAFLGKRQQEFTWRILFAGIFKGAVIYVAIGGLIVVANILPDLSVIINGVEYTIISAMEMLLFAEIAWYLKEVVEKLILVLASKSKDAVIEPVYDEGNYLRDDVGKG